MIRYLITNVNGNFSKIEVNEKTNIVTNFLRQILGNFFTFSLEKTKYNSITRIAFKQPFINTNPGDILKEDFVIFSSDMYHNYGSFYSIREEFFSYFKDFKFRINNTALGFDLEMYIINHWEIALFDHCKFSTEKRFLFKENQTTVWTGYKDKFFLQFENKNIQISKYVDDKGFDYYNGLMPEEIYTDYVKDSQVYSFVKGLE